MKVIRNTTFPTGQATPTGRMKYSRPDSSLTTTSASQVLPTNIASTSVRAMLTNKETSSMRSIAKSHWCYRPIQRVLPPPCVQLRWQRYIIRNTVYIPPFPDSRKHRWITRWWTLTWKRTLQKRRTTVVRAIYMDNGTFWNISSSKPCSHWIMHRTAHGLTHRLFRYMTPVPKEI